MSIMVRVQNIGRLICLVLADAVLLSANAVGFQAPPESSQSVPAADDSFSPQGPYFGKLTIPAVVRYNELPMRMHLEPTLEVPAIINSIDDRMVPLFTRALKDASDLEVRTVAAMSLARVAEYEELSIDSAATQILETLKSSKDSTVLYASALAAANGNIRQAAPELIGLAQKGNDSQRAVIEPALIRWKAQEASVLWVPRLSDSTCSDTAFRFAAEGLSALQDQAAVTPLSGTVIDEAMSFGKRLAAAKAIALLDPAKGVLLAKLLMKGQEADKLLTLSLLDSALPEAWQLAASICLDESHSVASNAWQLVLNRNPELLLDHLSMGRSYDDSIVRITAASVMKLFPTPERCSWLNEMLDDRHIQVRNTARQSLADVALKEEGLYAQIVDEAVNKLKMSNTNWQGIEQGLVLLGQIRATRFSDQCYPLLKYPRDEVSVSAAWLIHLFPDDALRAQLLTTVQDLEKEIVDVNLTKADSVLKQQYLLQAAAILRIQEIMPLLEPKFSKAAPGGIYERAAAMWAIGMLMERNPDPSVVKRLEERIQDRSSIPPEYEQVRRSCVMALGLMRAKSSINVIRESYTIDPVFALIPQTARFVQGVLGEEVPPKIPDLKQLIGGWRLNPPDP